MQKSHKVKVSQGFRIYPKFLEIAKYTCENEMENSKSRTVKIAGKHFLNVDSLKFLQ